MALQPRVLPGESGAPPSWTGSDVAGWAALANGGEEEEGWKVRRGEEKARGEEAG